MPKWIKEDDEAILEEDKIIFKNNNEDTMKFNEKVKEVLKELAQEAWRQGNTHVDGNPVLVEEALASLRRLIVEEIEGMKKKHKDGDDCQDCGLFNVIGGEICDCEYNEALTDLQERVGKEK